MKKILLFILLLSGISFAQVTTSNPYYYGEFPFNNETAWRGAPMLFYSPDDSTYWNPVHVDGVLTVGTTVAGLTTFGHGLTTATTSAIAIGSGATKTITITNNTSGGEVRYGGSGVTLLNGTLLQYLDSFTITVGNLDLIYIISPTTCDVTYTYGN